VSDAKLCARNRRRGLIPTKPSRVARAIRYRSTGNSPVFLLPAHRVLVDVTMRDFPCIPFSIPRLIPRLIQAVFPRNAKERTSVRRSHPRDR